MKVILSISTKGKFTELLTQVLCIETLNILLSNTLC